MLIKLIDSWQWFNDWAPYYDQDTLADNWCAPDRIVESAQKHYLSETKRHENLRILDVGVGTGILSQKFRSVACNSHIIGTDVSPDMIDLCREKNIVNEVMLNDVSKGLPFPDHSFDIVAAAGVMELVVDYENAIREMMRVTKPGGIIPFTAEIFPKSGVPDGYVFSPDGKFFADAGRGEYCEISNVSQDRVKDLFRAAGVKLVECDQFIGYSNPEFGSVPTRIYTGLKPKCAA